ncbi:MAG: glycosyl hydrolase [Ideonella sp.]|nr:glycosyl hydrolase [Ideonella sp.]
MKSIRAAIAALAATSACACGLAAAAGFQDPLAVAAQPSLLASRSLLQGVARAGSRLIAVGQRGHIVHSADGGGTWQQAAVPVSSDLTAVFFVNERKGWAVGHDGVVLHSADGGLKWTLQLDGRRANDSLVGYLQQRVQAQPQSAELKKLLDEARRYQEQGADKPFLDVWFADERNGYVVGAYNLIFRTADGGASWEPWFDRTDNPKLLNLYGIAAAGGGVYVVGESGLVLRLDSASQRFQARPTPYAGSFFGVVGTADTVVAFGLRGNAYRSDDGGTRWDKVEAGLPATIVAATSLPGGALVLADAGGRVAVSDGAGREFKLVALKPSMPVAGIANAGNGRLALVGPRGVAVTALPAR